MATTPTDATKAQVWVTGSAPSQQLEFYIPRGAKGEAGGLVTPVGLAPTADLNSVLVPGHYTQAGGNVTTLYNYPVTYNAPVLIQVYSASSNTGVQILNFTYSARAGQVRYTRTWSSSGTIWTAWKTIAATRVDQTAGRAIYQWDDLNLREQLIYGDTGWRDVRSDLLNGATASVFNIRRIGSDVSIDISGLQLPNAPDIYAVIYSAPAGFITRKQFVTLREDINTGGYGGLSWSGTFFLRGSISGAVFNNTSNRFSGGNTAVTNDTWPTTLPGVAVGTIPNL